MIGWILLAVIVILVFSIIGMYNGLVQSRVKVDNAWSQIDVQLQRRFDLIPNFVETVKGYMNHEKETFEKISQLRTSWANTQSISEKANLDNQLSTALKTIMAVSENYPELKANQNFSDLSEELRNTENKISFSRQFYNDTVTMYNTKLQVFPSNIIAGMFHFEARDLFKAESDEARKNVKVDFGSNS
ncbi:MAG: LemA family protein [Clostridia bacterium]|nr:LemA family protein [Clostridia bacterium]